MNIKRRTRHRAVVELTPRQGQSEASVEADFARSFALGEAFAANGSQLWRSYFRRVGPFKFMVAKEVGPPPWRLPRIGVNFKRKPLHVGLVAGWRSTAYRLHLMWAGAS